MLQFVVNLAQPNSKKLTNFLLTDSVFMSGQRNLIIDLLTQGAKLSSYLTVLSSHHGHTPHHENEGNSTLKQASSGKLSAAKIFDGDKVGRYEDLANQASESSWSDALLLGSIFCSEKDRK